MGINFSFVLNRYFIKPIQNLVSYTKIIKEKSHKKTGIDNLKNRNDELGLLSKSLEDMTNELQKRVAHAENFSTDLVHEIRNPLASLKSASEILQDTNNSDQRLKLLNILNHDVQRIERLITDYSQMLKDEVALSKEKMKKIISLLLILLLSSCTTASRFGAGVNITFDPRTIGMQIDDTIMQKNLSARLALADKKYFLTIQSEVLDGRIFLSGKVDEPEEKIKITKPSI